MKASLLTVIAIVSSFVTLPSVMGQGSLTPPGPPAPAMMTLSQIEPRTPISSVPYTITAAGSYYLTGNLYVSTSMNAITVRVGQVTIDLAGFGIFGETGGGCAIAVSNNIQNLIVRNGTIDYWGTALQGTSASASLVEKVQCYQMLQNGLVIGGNSIVRDCTVVDPGEGGGGTGILTGDGTLVAGCSVLNDFNHFSNGIQGGRGCTIDSSITTSNAEGVITSDGAMVRNCNFYANTGNGLQTGSGCTISDCTAWKNGSEGLGIPAFSTGSACTISGCTVSQNSVGITTGPDSTIKECTVVSNITYGVNAGVGCTISDCTANYNTNGILANSESTITGCTVSANYIDGIQTTYSCLIKGNTCSSNSRYIVNGGAGIHVLDSGNRIEGNVLNSNQYGIKADGTENIVIANTARGSGTANYDLVSGNMVDTIINVTASGAVLGSTGGASLGTTDPWANFSF